MNFFSKKQLALDFKLKITLVLTHNVTKTGKGFFKRSLLFGSVSLSPHTVVRQPLKKALKFARLLNCSQKHSGFLVTCVKNKSLNDLLRYELVFY